MMMPTIEERELMSDDELNALLRREVSKIVRESRPENQPELRLLQDKINQVCLTSPSHFAATMELFKLMSVKFGELNKSLNGG